MQEEWGSNSTGNRATQQKLTKARKISRALGWFSIGLGAAQLLMPGSMVRLIGIRDRGGASTVMRTMGMREIGHGVAVLSRPASAASLWSRVAGDALDLALLAAATAQPKNDSQRLAMAAASVAGVAALDVYNSISLSRIPKQKRRAANRSSSGGKAEAGIRVRRSFTIRKPVDEVYAFWHDFENLPRFMQHLESVEVIDERRSRWTTTAPAGKTLQWEAEVVHDAPNRHIEWRSLDGAEIPNRGRVEFRKAPRDLGTEVHVDLRYDPPAGRLGKLVATFFGEAPAQQIQDDVHAFKQVMETGEAVRSEGTLRGRHLQHPAQLPEDEAA